MVLRGKKKTSFNPIIAYSYSIFFIELYYLNAFAFIGTYLGVVYKRS